ncbi:hypothetical protein LB505_011106 [Fusarium chuoi]|nr:hypothetical protein LB505_011106 [Fusarium chuoi]
MVLIFLLASLAVSSSVLAAPNYAVPDAQPTNAVAIDSAPVGLKRLGTRLRRAMTQLTGHKTSSIIGRALFPS